MDILAISCDSFNEETNFTIGRYQDGKNHLASLKAVKYWCNQYKVAFKVNTVVNTYNLEEDMVDEILELNPIRWKVICVIYPKGRYRYLISHSNATALIWTCSGIFPSAYVTVLLALSTVSPVIPALLVSY